MRLRTPLVAAAALAVGLTVAAGCSGLASIGAGYVASPSGQPGRQGGGLNVYLGGGPSPNAGMSLGLRTKFTENVQQVAVSVDGYLIAPTESGVMPMARLGIHGLQFESVDSAFAFGMFSPYAEVGVAFLTDWIGRAADVVGVSTKKVGGPFISITASAEYIVRFSDAPDEFWWGAYLNTGIVFGSKGL